MGDGRWPAFESNILIKSANDHRPSAIVTAPPGFANITALRLIRTSGVSLRPDETRQNNRQEEYPASYPG